MNVLGIIPARYASTRLEGKPLLDLCGKSMIQRVYEQAKKALKFVVVATDDERIKEEVIRFGGHVIMTSPYHTTGTNRCLEAYELFTKKSDQQFDVVINIQGDEPLLDPEQITSLVSCFEDIEVEMATLVIPSSGEEDLKSGVFVVLDKDLNAMYFSRSIIPNLRDELRENWTNNHRFYKHVGMYGFRGESLKKYSSLEESLLEKSEKLEQLRWLENGNKIRVAITNHKSIPVDTKEDLEKVRNVLQGRM